MFKKLITLSLIIGLGWWAYSRYGYLVQSYRNQPPKVKIQDSSPLTLPKPPTDARLQYLTVPPGFSITQYATDVPGARSLTHGANNVIYVGTRSQGVVYALEDTDNDGRADKRFIVASKLNNPNGVAYHDGSLYVAEIHRIIKFSNIDSTYQTNPQPQVVYDNLPKETHHGWRYLRVGPDNKLYLGIGAPCNICRVEDPFASISRVNTDGSNFEVIQRGIRNTVGFDWNPTDNSLWFTDNGRDQMGDNTPPDELNRATDIQAYYGFPFCHGKSITDPQFNKGENCRTYTAAALELGPHVAALGMRFYRGDMFPAEFKNKIIIAEHGSWNRTAPIGYRLMTVDVNGSQAGSYKEFVTGWLDGQDAKGRPVDLLELPDGSLLISDDLTGAIYRLTYSND